MFITVRTTFLRHCICNKIMLLSRKGKKQWNSSTAGTSLLDQSESISHDEQYCEHNIFLGCKPPKISKNNPILISKIISCCMAYKDQSWFLT